jgi:hypothetical protein
MANPITYIVCNWINCEDCCQKKKILINNRYQIYGSKLQKTIASNRHSITMRGNHEAHLVESGVSSEKQQREMQEEAK